MKRALTLGLVLIATAVSAADLQLSTRHDELRALDVAPSRASPSRKVQWAPSGNFSALHTRAVFRGEIRSESRPCGRERSKTAAGAGIFLSRDRAEGTLNSAPSLHRFAYAADNPLRYVDPTGHCWIVPGSGQISCFSWRAYAPGIQKSLNGFEPPPIWTGLNEGTGKLLAGGLNAGNLVAEMISVSGGGAAGRFDSELNYRVLSQSEVEEDQRTARAVQDKALQKLAQGPGATAATVFESTVVGIGRPIDTALQACGRADGRACGAALPEAVSAGFQAWGMAKGMVSGAQALAELGPPPRFAPATVGVGSSEGVVVEGRGLSNVVAEPGQSTVVPMAKPKGVKPYETGEYGKLKTKSAPNDKMDLDHQPSNASNIERAKAELGRPLTPEELKEIKAKGTAVAVPAKLHQQSSPTYGGRNTPAQIVEDAADPTGAARRDAAAMVEAAAPKNRAAAAAAAKEIKQRAKDLE